MTHVPYRIAESIVLERYAPPSVVISGDDQIVYYLGAVTGLLHHPRGEPSQNLMLKLDDPLRSATRELLRQVRTSGTRGSVVSSQLIGGVAKQVEVEVLPLRGIRPRDHLLVVMHIRDAETGAVQPMLIATPEARDFEQELRSAHEEMQATIRQMEGLNEELTAANEETASMNEELQAANEELETSKEELQSVNEELRTVNVELEEKVESLKQASDDLTNLLRSTNIPTLFLDRELRLRRFTPTALSLFNFLASDAGRPIADLSFSLEGMDLATDTRKVLANLQPVGREVEAADGRLYLHRTQPYRTEAGAVEGVVATFVDITELANSRTELKLQAAQMRVAALQLTEVEHTERARLAKVLHDGIQQALAALTLKLAMAAAAKDDALQSMLSEAQQELRGIITVTRELTTTLNPPVRQDQPLAESLQWLVESMQGRYDYTVRLKVEAADPTNHLVKTVLFEAARELLFNSVKHSGATEGEVSLELADGDMSVLTVSDAGSGFDPAVAMAGPNGLGLFSIRERLELLGGTMEIDSAPGRGATIRLRVPRQGPEKAMAQSQTP